MQCHKGNKKYKRQDQKSTPNSQSNVTQKSHVIYNKCELVTWHMQVVALDIVLINEETLPGILSVAIFRKDNQPEFKHVGSARRNRNMEQFTQTLNCHENISAQKLITVFLLQLNIPSTCNWHGKNLTVKNNSFLLNREVVKVGSINIKQAQKDLRFLTILSQKTFGSKWVLQIRLIITRSFTRQLLHRANCAQRFGFTLKHKLSHYFLWILIDLLSLSKSCTSKQWY